jgi:hypothetical protein
MKTLNRLVSLFTVVGLLSLAVGTTGCETRTVVRSPPPPRATVVVAPPPPPVVQERVIVR